MASCVVPSRRSAWENYECSDIRATVGLLEESIGHYKRRSSKSGKALERNLERISALSEECSDMMGDFLDIFPEWKFHREIAIEYLMDAVEKLDNIHFITNVTKTAASVGGMISSLVGIASAIARLAGSPAASSLRLAASIGNVVSSAASTGAAITEAGLSKTYTDKAKWLLRADSERLEKIQMWFERTQELKNAIEEICNRDILMDLFKQLVIIVPKVMNICDALAQQIDDVVGQVVNALCKNMTLRDVEKIIFLCISVCRNPELLESIKNIHQTLQNKPFIMPLITMVVKIPSEMNFLVPYIHDFKAPSVNEKASKKEAITYGLFQGVNVAIEMFSLSLLVQDFEKGSVSEQSAILRKLETQLKLELDLVSDLHKKLKQID